LRGKGFTKKIPPIDDLRTSPPVAHALEGRAGSMSTSSHLRQRISSSLAVLAARPRKPLIFRSGGLGREGSTGLRLNYSPGGFPNPPAVEAARVGALNSQPTKWLVPMQSWTTFLSW